MLFNGMFCSTLGGITGTEGAGCIWKGEKLLNRLQDLYKGQLQLTSQEP